AFKVANGRLDLERAVVTHVPTSALNIHSDSEFDVSDFDASDIYASPMASIDENDARGLVMANSRGVLERVRVRDSGSHAMVLDQSSVTIRDLIIADNRGRGLTAQDGSEIGAERVWLDRNQGIGFYVNVDGGMNLSDVAVTNTATLPCDDAVCDTPSEGFGVGLYEGAELTMQRFAI